MRSARIRAMASDGPPAENGTTMVMDATEKSPRTRCRECQHRNQRGPNRSTHHISKRRMTATNTNLVRGAAPLRGVSKDEKRIGSWFETREDALLTMRDLILRSAPLRASRRMRLYNFA